MKTYYIIPEELPLSYLMGDNDVSCWVTDTVDEEYRVELPYYFRHLYPGDPYDTTISIWVGHIGELK